MRSSAPLKSFNSEEGTTEESGSRTNKVLSINIISMLWSRDFLKFVQIKKKINKKNLKMKKSQ